MRQNGGALRHPLLDRAIVGFDVLTQQRVGLDGGSISSWGGRGEPLPYGTWSLRRPYLTPLPPETD